MPVSFGCEKTIVVFCRFFGGWSWSCGSGVLGVLPSPVKGFEVGGWRRTTARGRTGWFCALCLKAASWSLRELIAAAGVMKSNGDGFKGWMT